MTKIPVSIILTHHTNDYDTGGLKFFKGQYGPDDIRVRLEKKFPGIGEAPIDRIDGSQESIPSIDQIEREQILIFDILGTHFPNHKRCYDNKQVEGKCALDGVFEAAEVEPDPATTAMLDLIRDQDVLGTRGEQIAASWLMTSSWYHGDNESLEAMVEYFIAPLYYEELVPLHIEAPLEISTAKESGDYINFVWEGNKVGMIKSDNYQMLTALKWKFGDHRDIAVVENSTGHIQILASGPYQGRVSDLTPAVRPIQTLELMRKGMTGQEAIEYINSHSSNILDSIPGIPWKICWNPEHKTVWGCMNRSRKFPGIPATMLGLIDIANILQRFLGEKKVVVPSGYGY